MDWSEKRIEPRFKSAPSQEIVTFVQLPLEQPLIQMAIWGLKPFWLEKGLSLSLSRSRSRSRSRRKPPPINARAEALGSSPMFREARRCLIPATGFYEWRNKQPMHIQLKDGVPFAFAGLWLPPVKRDGLPTAAIITTRPNELMATIHTRMPAILGREDEQQWLAPDTTEADAKQLLKPYTASQMVAYPVSPKVNSWENEGAELIEPADPDSRQDVQMPLL